MESANQATWKRVLKCAVSLTVFAGTRIARAWTRLIGGKVEATCVVLYYHSIPSQQRVDFARQLDTLLRKAKPIALNGEVELTPGVHHAAVTFDDGFANYIEEAWPELQARRIPSVVFVVAGALGKSFGSAEHSEPLMSVEQLRSLPTGLVSIGSHTLTHPMLTRVSKEDACHEITQSRMKLEATFGREIVLFSFPFGDFSPNLVTVCAQAGYQHIYTTLPYLAYRTPEEFVVGRVRVDPTDWPIEFELKLAGAYRWLPCVFAIKRRIVSAARRFAATVGLKPESRTSRPGPSMIREPGGR